MDIKSSEDAKTGLRIVITVHSVNGEFFSSMDVYLPDEETFDLTQFEVAQAGLVSAHEQIDAILKELLANDD